MKRSFALLDVLGALVLILLAIGVVFRFNHQIEQRLYRDGETRNRLRHAAWALSYGDAPPSQPYGEATRRDDHVWVLRRGDYLYYVYAPRQVPADWRSTAHTEAQAAP